MYTWIEHCGRHPDCPAALLLACQDPFWLQTLRALYGSFGHFGSLDVGRTGTRAGPGKPIRYLGPWFHLIDFENEARDRSKSRGTAQIVWTAGLHGQLYSMDVR